MQIYRARAFTNKSGINGKAVLGNPASVVFCSEMLPSHEDMGKIALAEKAPMTAFIRQQQDNFFDIEFYTPAGERFGLCGHATLVAAHFIYHKYGYEKAFFYKLIELDDTCAEIIESYKDGDTFKISMPAYKPTILKEFTLDYAEIMGINAVESVYKCNQLNDIILVLKNTELLRKSKPMFHELAVVLAADNIRGIFLTAPSEEDGINYEVRIFAPHLGINEDISCGSANCSLIPFWHERLHAHNGDNFKILCPYNETAEYYGGIEIGSYDKENKRIYIGGLISEA